MQAGGIMWVVVAAIAAGLLGLALAAAGALAVAITHAGEDMADWGRRDGSGGKGA